MVKIPFMYMCLCKRVPLTHFGQNNHVLHNRYGLRLQLYRCLGFTSWVGFSKTGLQIFKNSTIFKKKNWFTLTLGNIKTLTLQLNLLQKQNLL